MSTGKGNENQGGFGSTGSLRKVNFCGMRDGYDSDENLVSSSAMGDDVEVDVNGEVPLLANQGRRSPAWELQSWEQAKGKKADGGVCGHHEQENVEVDVVGAVAGGSGNCNHNGAENDNQIKKGIHALKRMMDKIKKNSKRKKKEDATEVNGNCNGNNGNGNAEPAANPLWTAMERHEVDLMGGAAGGWAVDEDKENPEEDFSLVDVE